MNKSTLNKNGYDDSYLSARGKIDALCAAIANGATTLEEAQARYGNIEAEFAGLDPESADLFRMIYKNRVERLCGQFISGGDHGP